MNKAKITYWVIFALAVLFAGIQNLQGLEGYHGASNPFAAFDELYSIREVFNILISSNLKSLGLNIIAGKGFMYGRFIYICDALIAFIPFKLFGLNGLVFSVRMAHSLYLLLGFHFIIKYLNVNYLQKTISLLLLVSLPVTLYFIVMPKPEPMQLLLIGLFFNFKPKNWSWIFIGLALGSKISIAFSCLFIFSISIWLIYKNHSLIKSTINKYMFGLIGLLIALPALPLAIINKYFRAGLLNIVTTTTKPYDDPTITFSDWVIKWFHYYYSLPFIFSLLLTCIILVGTILILKKHKEYIPYAVFSVLILLPIMILAKRMWGHYLFLGTAMLIPFIPKAIEEFIPKRKIVLAHIAILALFSVNIISESHNYINSLQRNKTLVFQKAKAETLNAIAISAEAYPNAELFVELKLYHEYKWSLEDGEIKYLSTNQDDYYEHQYIIASKNEAYLLEDDNYKIKKTSGSVALFVRK